MKTNSWQNRWPLTLRAHVPKPIRTLSPSDMRQIDAWVEWWFDTDTLFGLANMLLAAVGAIGFVIWALVSAFATGLSFTSLVLIPIAALFIGFWIGAVALAGGILWLLWQAGGWILGILP